ncbi:HD domain-containing protein [Spiroplasma endosymbiont of Aspidapion aeneum]|uniref:HD domain-containing protein n=1 Tax=Spiroplasma endosymbiont of Aspidapion aeneum TaxID=3066276 RepID=UPI00313C282A
MENKFVKYFRDNVHGDILVDEMIVYELINTNFFQRLRRIEQLGGAKYVFLGANHTRFSHCIGVYHIVCKFLLNPNIVSAFSDYEIKVLKVSGLLHDIGHGPFSHTFEWILENAVIDSHEQYSSKIIREDPEILKILKIYNINPEDVCSVIEGKNKKLSPLISSQVDADRIDYLLRDGLLVGVNYAASDVEWIIRNSLYKDEDMIFNYKAKSSLESYLLGRYHMYEQVYLHKTSIAFDETLRSWFERLIDLKKINYNFINIKMIDILKEVIEKKVIPLNKYYLMDDYLLINFFQDGRLEKDEIFAKLSYMLVNRHFLKVVDNFNESGFQNFKNNLGNKEDVKYFCRKQKVSSLQLYRVKSKHEEIKLLLKNGDIKSLDSVSSLIKNSNKKSEKSVLKSNYLYLFSKDYI